MERSTAIDRAFDVIELIAASQADLPFSLILEELDIPRQSLVRILNTLCDRGVIDRTNRRGFYKLGMITHKTIELKDKQRIGKMAMEAARKISKKSVE